MSPLMLFHVITGTIAVLAGAVALTAKKGSYLHRQAGKVFTVTMIAMASAGAIIGLMISQAINVLAGIITCYLVITAWMAAKRPKFKPNYQDLLAFLVIFTVGLSGMVFGLEAMKSASGTKGGYGPFPYFFMGGLALMAATLDLNMYRKKGLNNKHRMARHIWRTCVAFFIAAGSLFTGPGAKAFPSAVRESGILGIPEPLILVLMLYWLGRTFIVRRPKQAKAR